MTNRLPELGGERKGGGLLPLLCVNQKGTTGSSLVTAAPDRGRSLARCPASDWMGRPGEARVTIDSRKTPNRKITAQTPVRRTRPLSPSISSSRNPLLLAVASTRSLGEACLAYRRPPLPPGAGRLKREYLPVSDVAFSSCPKLSSSLLRLATSRPRCCEPLVDPHSLSHHRWAGQPAVRSDRWLGLDRPTFHVRHRIPKAPIASLLSSSTDSAAARSKHATGVCS